MVRYCFTRGDLLRTRFAIAPLMELVGAVYVLREPARFAVHQPWVERVAPRVAALDLGLLDAAAPATTRGSLSRAQLRLPTSRSAIAERDEGRTSAPSVRSTG